MKTGILSSWWPRGYGMVCVTLKENYFLHVSNIVEIPEGLIAPPIGSTIHFDVGPAYKKGKYEQALNARVIPPVEGGR